MGAYAAKYDTAEKRREYDRERKRDYREIRGKGLRGKRFIGVDGEGGKDSEGHHQYYLLTAGEWKIATGNPLTTRECLTFLGSLPPDAYYVGYFFDYDVTMILRGLPPEKIARLFNREDRTREVAPGREYCFPVDWEGFQIDYLPHKEFKVRHYTGRTPKGIRTFSPWVVINDVGTFFQCSFVKALDLWDIGTPEQQAAIAEGKDMRADFGQLTKEVVEYNALEIVLLQKLMDEFRGVCEDIGYVPARWQGPGNLATAMLRHHGVPKNKDINVPDPVVEAAGAAYYGGRFETTIVGSIDGPVYAYDINSAYPDALTQLPCLIHGDWDSITADQLLPGDLYLAHGRYEQDFTDTQGDFMWDPPKTKRPGLFNFPCRDKGGRIYYPAAGSGWYWSVEIEQAVHQTFTPDTIWVYRPCCDCIPFDWVPDVYDMRIALGKSKKGGVLKLGLNSIYGKMAQSIGAAPYANPVWAGLITAITRAKLMSVSHYPHIMGLDVGFQEGCLCSTVLMLATDAVFTTTRLHVTKSGAHKGGWHEQKIVPSKKLGDWDLTTHDSLHIIQPGLYFTSKGAPPKTRGVPRQRVIELEQEFRAVFNELSHKRITPDGAFVMVPLRQFIGLRIANHRNRLDLAGEWLWCGEDEKGQWYDGIGPRKVDSGKRVSYQWKNKRQPSTNYGASGINPPRITYPYFVDGGETVPYDKDIGRMRAMDRMLDSGTLDAPDWADNLFDRDM
jgi:hypothetical protein